jgi:hypothetical protein
MHVVEISGFTRVLLVCTCQQGAHPRGRPTPLVPRWKDNIKMNFKGLVRDSVDWASLSQGREN